MRTQKQWIKHLDFTVLDMAVTALAFLCACALRPGAVSVLLREAVYRNTLVGLVAAAGVIGLLFQVHRNILRRSAWKECTETLKFVLLLAVIISFWNYISKVSNELSRFVFGVWILLDFGMLFAARCLYKTLLNRRIRAGNRLPRLVLIADGRDADRQLAVYRTKGEKQFRIAALAVFSGAENAAEAGTVMAQEGIPVLPGKEALYDFMQTEVVDEVLIADSALLRDDELLQSLMSAGMTIYISLDEIGEVLPNKHMDRIADQIVLASTVQPFSPEQMILKRLADILIALVGLAVTGVVFVIFAPIIVIQSPGPVFFSQIRVGMNGRRFRMYKFRSMYPDAEARKAELMEQNRMKGGMFKIDNDPRVIPIGRFMRKYSLDELPQFYNVLRGEMSAVGTRPPTVDEWEQYSLEHRARLSMKPGVTGLWQVSGRSDIVDFDEVVSLDMKYIREWNIRKDLKIILQTIRVVFTGSGAY